MRSVIVHHDVHVKLLRNIFIDLLEKVQIFLMPVPRFALGDYLPVGDVERGEERRGAVTPIIVSYPLDVSEAHRQHGLGSVQGLDLALFIHALSPRRVGWVQIQPDNITHFFNKKWIGRKLKMPLPVRLKSKRMPDAVHSRVRDFSPWSFRQAFESTTAYRLSASY